MILAFDTSSALTSVAVVDGSTVVAMRSHHDPRRHAEVLAPLFAELRGDAEPSGIAAVACGVGPGPYTGLRVGIATALAVGTAWQRPVVGICSLDAIAMAVLDAAPRPDGFGVAVDARRKEVYWAWYSGNGSRIEGPRVAPPGAIDPGLRAGDWAGHGAALHAPLFGALLAGGETSDPASYAQAGWVGRRAVVLLEAGESPLLAAAPLDAHGEDTGATSQALGGHDLLPPRPLYLRRPDAVASGGAT
jgi:tRNA threonylcarbamoyladenosine biosynthesis protein TsaB